MALTDLTRISTSGIATGTSLSGAILHGDAHFRGTQVGVTSALFDSSDNALEFNDDVKLKLGNSGDFEIYHRGADGVSIINETGSAYLSIGSNGDKVELYDTANGRSMAEFATGGACSFKHGSTIRFKTTDHGAVVTGILTATSFSGPLIGSPINNPSGISTFYDLRVSNNLTVEGTTSTLDTTLIGVDRVEVGANSNTVVGIAVTQSGTADIVNLFDGATKVVTVDDVGNVGLGSAIPSAKLDVVGTAKLGQTTIAHTAASQLIIKDSDTSGNGSSMRISFKDSGNTERFYIGNDESSNSYLYLGSPSGQNNNVALTVGGSTKLTAFSGGIGVNGDLELQDTIYHAGDTDTKIRFPSNDNISFETGGSERFRVASSLVTATTTLVAPKIVNSTSFTSHNGTFYGGNVNTGGVRIELAHTTTTVSGNTASGAFPHNLLLSNYSGSGSADNRMVSIGFDIPTTSSHANATIAYQATASNGTGDLQFWLENGNTSYERVRFKADGSVGIGITNPSAKFVVSNAGANGFEFNPNFNSNNSIIASYNRSGGGAYTQLTLSASQHIFSQGGTEYGRFTSAGNFNLLKDLDVDGHTELDNLNVAGISTFTGNLNASGTITSSSTGVTYGPIITSNNPAGPKLSIHATATGGKHWMWISNGSSNTDGAGYMQLWNSSDSFSPVTFGYDSDIETNFRTGVEIDGNFKLGTANITSPYNSFKRISINNNLVLNAANSPGGFAGMQHNAYLNSSGNWVRINNDHATSIGTDDGNFYIRNVGAGTGNISWNMPVKIQASNRINIGEGNSGSALGAVHINTSSVMGTDTALWIGDNANKRYMTINQVSNSEQFSHMELRFNDNGRRNLLYLSNPYGPAGYGSGILWRGYNDGTQAYIETSSEGANNANSSMYIYTSGNKGLRIRHSGTVQAQEALVSRNGIVQINQVTSETRYSGSIASVDLITGSNFYPKTNSPRFLIMIFCPVNTSDDSDAYGSNTNPYHYGRIEYRKNGGSWLECNNQGSTSNQGGYAAHIDLSPNRTGDNTTDHWSGNRYRLEHKCATILATNVGDCGDGGTVQFKLRGYSHNHGSFVQIGQPHGNQTDDNYAVQPWGFTVFELAPDSNSYTPY